MNGNKKKKQNLLCLKFINHMEFNQENNVV